MNLMPLCEMSVSLGSYAKPGEFVIISHIFRFRKLPEFGLIYRKHEVYVLP